MNSNKLEIVKLKLQDKCFLQSLLPNYFLSSILKAELVLIPKESVLLSSTGKNQEIIIAINGCGGIVINGFAELIKTGDIIHVYPNSIRSIANVEDEVLQVVSITLN